MTDSNSPITPVPDTAELARGRQLAPSPAPSPAPSLAHAPGVTGGAVLAGGAALAVLALVFLKPRLGGLFARWQGAAIGTRLLSLLRSR